MLDTTISGRGEGRWNSTMRHCNTFRISGETIERLLKVSKRNSERNEVDRNELAKHV